MLVKKKPLWRIEEHRKPLVTKFGVDATSFKTGDAVFSFDTTSSMSSYLAEVRRNLRHYERVFGKISTIRIAIIAHGDYCDTSIRSQKLDLCETMTKLLNSLIL